MDKVGVTDSRMDRKVDKMHRKVQGDGYKGRGTGSGVDEVIAG